DDLERNLPIEEDRIEPGHVQIICVRLWQRIGRDLAGSTDATVPYAIFQELGGVDGILRGHFKRFLDSYPDVLDQLEILDLLEPLITLNRRRNIVERELLEKGPLHHTAHR